MIKSTIELSFICLVALILLTSCQQKKTEIVWDKNLPVIGSQSSPRAADLNGDGILDIVVGAGKNEYQHSEQGILAFDGKTGDILWQQEATDQVFGSATFYDINGDGVKDVFIGGRSAQLKALDGKTGAVIWAYEYKYEQDSILKYARYNFYNSVLMPDQNQDGLPDLLIQNGGNVKAAPNSEENRFPGVLMVLDIMTGDILAADTMPDGKESYMSPLFFTQPGGQELILFGTGGETIDGRLYLARLSDLMEGQLSRAVPVASEKGHGFIAPPVLADITQDGYYDIVAISHGSSVFAIDGKDRKLLWKQRIPGTESSNSFAVGYFTEDDIPDFFTFVSEGVWPYNSGSLEVMLDGRDGRLAFVDSLGCIGFSSPVIYDLNGDGRDEAIISINDYECGTGFNDPTEVDIVNKLIAINFKDSSVYPIEQLPGFKNIFSTPWIGDLDRDGYLDIIHCQYYYPSSYMLAFLGMRVKRISTSVRMRKPVVWGAYMGSNGDGIFSSEERMLQ
jgi:outer membrane protein assembly factor BamB